MQHSSVIINNILGVVNILRATRNLRREMQCRARHARFESVRALPPIIPYLPFVDQPLDLRTALVDMSVASHLCSR